MKLLSGLILLCSLLATPAAHAIEVGVLGGLDFYNPSMSNATVVSPSSAIVGGAYFQTSFNALLDMDIGVMYAKKKADYTVLAATTTIDTSSIQIPVILRTGFVPGSFVNVGAGAYYESTGTPPAGFKSSDFGLVGSAQVRLPLAPLMKFVIDARYLYGLGEQSSNTATNTISNRSVQVLGGFTLGI
jgi:hypothetical protein